MSNSPTMTLSQPSALMAQMPRPETDFHRPALIGFAIIGVALGGFATWAAVAPLGSAEMAQGVVTVESKRKIVQHREGGILAELLVKEGDQVAAGTVIARLADAGALALQGNLAGQRDAKLAELARLSAERDNLTAVAFPPALAARGDETKVLEAIGRERARFDQRKKSLDGQLGILQAHIAELQAQRGGRVQLEQSKRRQLVLLRQELTGLRELQAKGFYPTNKLRAEERELARLEGDTYADVAGTTQIDKEIGEAQLQILQTSQKFREEVSTDLARTEVELQELDQRLGAARDAVERLVVVAPVGGTVQSLKPAGPGAVVAPGGEIAEIVPGGDRLVIDSQVTPKDIDRVHEGQPAHLRFTAFGARQTPVVEGRVTVVSADRFTEQGGSHQSYYSARVEVTPDQLARLPGGLKAGMPVEVMLDGGERTALQYMVKPLSDNFARSFNER